MTEPVRTVQGSAVESNRRRGGDIRVLLSPRTVGATSGFFGTVELAAGEVVREHYHPHSEEFLYVVEGAVRLRLDGSQVLTLHPGTAVMVPINVRHRLENVHDGVSRCVFHLSPLAPRPDLGHVDTEPPADPSAAGPRVGGAP
ncbi:cupin domain-containing protein [Plantactinospora siamensis]|uniref:Cupin domain-containing protein n=1 Tax=Plantactinospora siamensis TaxID=555372 RepID=A0ABV6NWX1_9ACTN